MTGQPPLRSATGRSLSPHVLVVEDEPSQREMLAYNLSAEGFRVSVAATGDEGLSLIAADPPDVTLLDINLDGARTTPVALALAADGVPFIAVTAYASLPEPVFDGVPVVGKPFWPEQVRDALLALPRP